MPVKPFFRAFSVAVCYAAVMAVGAPAVAHEPHHRDHPEHGRHDGVGKQPRLSLQAAASSEVTQDTVEITLAAELEGAEQAEVAKRLTTQLNDTLEAARGHAGVTARNGAYRLWPNTDRDGKITAWRGRAEVVLESQDLPAAAQLASELSSHMAIANIAFSLSPQARAAEEKRLLKQAADAFAQRANDAASAFGFTGYRIRKIDLGGSGTVYAKRPEMAMMRAGFAGDAAAQPQLEAGQATVTITVQGEVVLETSNKP